MLVCFANHAREVCPSSFLSRILFTIGPHSSSDRVYKLQLGKDTSNNIRNSLPPLCHKTGPGNVPRAFLWIMSWTRPGVPTTTCCPISSFVMSVLTLVPPMQAWHCASR